MSRELYKLDRNLKVISSDALKFLLLLFSFNGFIYLCTTHRFDLVRLTTTYQMLDHKKGELYMRLAPFQFQISSIKSPRV